MVTRSRSDPRRPRNGVGAHESRLAHGSHLLSRSRARTQRNSRSNRLRRSPTARRRTAVRPKARRTRSRRARFASGGLTPPADEATPRHGAAVGTAVGGPERKRRPSGIGRPPFIARSSDGRGLQSSWQQKRRPPEPGHQLCPPTAFHSPGDHRRGESRLNWPRVPGEVPVVVRDRRRTAFRPGAGTPTFAVETAEIGWRARSVRCASWARHAGGGRGSRCARCTWWAGPARVRR